MGRVESVGDGSVTEEVSFPDEDTFEMPAGWRRLVFPRRGGIRRSVAELHPEAEELTAGRLKEEAAWVEEMLAAPKSDPRIVEALRAHLAGSHNSLGAAALAHLTMHYQLPDGVFVDAWVRAHGLPFAARAVVEYFDIEAQYRQYGGRREDPWLGYRPGTWTADGYWARPKFADRMRSLLAVAEEDAYRQTVAALDRCRDGARRRIVVSYLVPAELDWAAESCADAGSVDGTLRGMLLCSLNSPEQLDAFGSGFDLGWQDWSLSLVATLAEGLGKDIAPVLEAGLPLYGSDQTKTFAGALLELPTDEAFRLLLRRVEDKYVRPSLLEAMRRYPVRALRLLAEAALGSAAYAPMARQLLTAHVLAHPALTAAALPGLPARTAELVEPLLSRGDRVAEAPAEALPPLLVGPPWARKRKARKARVAAEAPVAPQPRAGWQPGEREEWAAAATSSYGRGWRTKDWTAEIASLREGGQLRYVSMVRLFLDGPEDVVRPLLAGCAVEDYWDGERHLKPVAAKFGVDAIPLLLRAAGRHPSTLGPVILPYLDGEAARLVCDWLARLKAADATARAWVARHGLAAVPYLVPRAVGPAGTVRRGAEKALRLVAAAHGEDAVLDAVAQAEARDIVRDLLTADPLETALPARMPAVGAWADPALLPQILLAESGAGALPAEAVRHVLTVLALSRPGEVYPGLDVLKAHLDADSLAAFAWGLFEQWRLSGMPAKDSWALHALGWFGDDETVRRLTPVLRAWPGEGAHHRAVEGLGVLATIGTDVALMHLHGIAQRVPFKALKLRAQEKIAEVAEGLGLTGEQLGDRLVPDFGLDADGSTVIDYGSRQFTVGFDEQLRPYVADADGKRRKALPAPGAKDDPELAPAERKRFAALKKDVRTVAADQVRRLEAAMVAQRAWTAGEFQELFVAHPLLWHLVRRLVWLGEADGKVTAFRVAEDRTFADVEDDELTLSGDATVRLAHPLSLAGELDAWAELFADYEILQPFPQLGRAVHALTDEEAAGPRLTRFEGATVPVGKLLGLTKRGWERGAPLDAGVERWFHRRIADDRYLVIDLDPGIPVGMVHELGDQTFRAVWLDHEPGDFWERRDYPLRFSGLDPVIASELLADLTEVTAK